MLCTVGFFRLTDLFYSATVFFVMRFSKGVADFRFRGKNIARGKISGDVVLYSFYKIGLGIKKKPMKM